MVVGDSVFKTWFNKTKVKYFRIVNDKDIVPKMGDGMIFHHAGVLVFINEDGLWFDPKDTAAISGASHHSTSEMISDHCITHYEEILESFTASCQSQWIAPGGELD